MNTDQIKSRLASLTQKNQKSQYLWKPKGKHVVRILPLKSNPEDPFIPLKFHYDLNGKTYLSPSTFGRPDPVVEYSNKLKKSGDEELWKKGRSMEPKMRTYVLVLVRGQENDGPKYWGFGKQVYEEILSIMSEPEYVNLHDPVNGYDLAVEFKEAPAGERYSRTTVRVKPKATPVVSDVQNAELLKKITQDQPDILSLFPEPTYEELNQALYEHLNPEVAADEPVEVDPDRADAGLVDVEPPTGAVTDPVVAPETTAVSSEPAVDTTTPPATAPVVSPTATKAAAASSKESLNDVFAAFDSLIKKNK